MAHEEQGRGTIISTIEEEKSTIWYAYREGSQIFGITRISEKIGKLEETESLEGVPDQ